MKTRLIFVFAFLLCLFQTKAQTVQINPCEMPAVIGMYDIPLYWGDDFGGNHSPLKTDRPRVLNKRIIFKMPQHLTHLHLKWIKLEHTDDQRFVDAATSEIEFDLNDIDDLPGTLVFRYKYRYNGNNDNHADLEIEVKPTQADYAAPDERWLISTDASYTTSCAAAYQPDTEFHADNADIGTAIASVKYAEGHTNLVKPVIFVTGFDPMRTSYTDPDAADPANNVVRHGGNGWDVFMEGAGEGFLGEGPDREKWSKFPESVTSLNAQGYDVVFLDFERGGDYIQKNAELLIELLKMVNEAKIPDDGGVNPT